MTARMSKLPEGYFGCQWCTGAVRYLVDTASGTRKWPSRCPHCNMHPHPGKVDETVLSLGTFGEASRTDDGRTIVPFTVDPSRLDDLELFAVTQERAPGVAISDQAPILAGTV